MKTIINVIVAISTCLTFAQCDAQVENNGTATEQQAQVAQKVEHVNAEQFQQLIQSGEYVLLDVRTPGEYNQGHIEGAQLIDFYTDFKQKVVELPKDQKYLVYCKSGNRSSQAAEMMEEMGFEKIVDLKGGIGAWNSKGYEVVR